MVATAILTTHVTLQRGRHRIDDEIGGGLEPVHAGGLRALDEIGVVLTPGIDFAPVRPGSASPTDGTRFVRISTAGAAEEIDEAEDNAVTESHRRAPTFVEGRAIPASPVRRRGSLPAQKRL